MPLWAHHKGAGVGLRGGRWRAMYMRMDTDVKNGSANGAGRREGASCREALALWRLDLARQLSEYAQRETRWSWVRLWAFAGAVGAIAGAALGWGFVAAMLAAIPAVGVFRVAIARHLRWKGRRSATERMLVVVDESLQHPVEEGKPVRDWRRPRDPEGEQAVLPVAIDSGPTWPLTEQELDDLDLYAPPVGIFGLLNRTSTEAGARRLRDMLNGPCLFGECIERRQRAVRWLDEHDRQRIELMASVVPLRGQSRRLDALVERLHRVAPSPYGKASKRIRIWSLFSGLFFIFALAAIFLGHYGWFRAIVLLIGVNVVILRVSKEMFAWFREAVLPLVRLTSALRGLLAVARSSEEHLPDEMDLGVLKQRFGKVANEAQIPSLCEHLGRMALGGLARTLLNLVVFYDLHVCEAVVWRVVSGRQTLLEGLAATAELEALASLACFGAEREGMCYPDCVDETRVSISEGRHPLISRGHVTANGVLLTEAERMWVITGPNAAGKSTYLRMVGVNVLLAQIGGAVAAGKMTLSPVRLLTDVRIRDDLARHESYFLSEVRRLRRMVADEGGPTRLLGLIDEPFRGTNSSERTAAGIALAEHLLHSGNLFLLATHEETLAQTASTSETAENRHFQEHLTDGGITFDYLLYPGPANTKTAIRILEQEQYPQSLLDRARQLMNP